MIEEIWKPVKDFEGLYEISNFGRVKSFRFSIPKIMKFRVNQKGYVCVGFTINGRSNFKKVHKLVAIAFLDHAPCGMEITVDHIDGNKLNNRVDNLQFLSNAENVRKYHATKHGYEYPRLCEVQGCTNTHDAKGMCKKHYYRNRYKACRTV